MTSPDPGRPATSHLDIDEAKVRWLAVRLFPDPFKGGDRQEYARIQAKVTAGKALAVLWDAGVLAVDPRRPERQV